MQTIDKSRLIFRNHYELPWTEGWELPMKGLRYYRHLWACYLEELACWVRGRHQKAWEPTWQDWFCENCGKTFDDMPPPVGFNKN